MPTSRTTRCRHRSRPIPAGPPTWRSPRRAKPGDDGTYRTQATLSGVPEGYQGTVTVSITDGDANFVDADGKSCTLNVAVLVCDAVNGTIPCHLAPATTAA